jgi:predicted nucleic acid-binding protein
MSGRDSIYWDSCIFIAHVKNEPRQDPLDMAGVSELACSFTFGQIELVTSTITITEVLRTSIGPENYEKFRKLFSWKNFQLIDVSKKIAEISHEIRDTFRGNQGATLQTPDCLHLATAIWFKCQTFYTFDGCDQKRPGLLSLSNSFEQQYNLIIKKPVPTSPPQLSFDLNHIPNLNP